MNVYTPGGSYQAELDVRFPDNRVPDWARLFVTGRPPNDLAWLVVMGRRTGKTWLASAIAHARPERTTRTIDLRSSNRADRTSLACLWDGESKPRLTEGVLLIDEPALAEEPRAAPVVPVDPATLVDGLYLIKEEAGVTPVVFATPREYSMLIRHLGPDAPKDVVLPPDLDDDEIARMTGRAPSWAPRVAASIRAESPAWLRTPFLLELALHIAEEHPGLRNDIPALLRAATYVADKNHHYREQLFNNGLSASQRAELRAGRWQAAGVTIPNVGSSDLLTRTPIPTDPVIRAYVPQALRIHHLSDLHFGGNLRELIDAKDRSRAGDVVSCLVGKGTPLDSYLSHVQNLAAAGRAPHLIVVSGDIVDRPDDGQGRQALDWLKGLESLLAEHQDLRPEDPRVVLVGGNHDVSWDLCLDERREARHEWFASTFKRYPHPDLHVADPARRRLFVEYPDAGLRIALLGSAESGGEPVHDADRELLEATRTQFADADRQATRDLIRSFERLDPGIVARPILDKLSLANGYLTLAVLHHPISSVPAVEIAPYTGIVNAGQVKQALISAGTALVLHGHTHLSFLAAERVLGPARTWTMRIAGAATLASADTDEPNGYNEILISREGSAHRLLVRPVRLDGGQWVPESGIAFRAGVPDECNTSDLAADP